MEEFTSEREILRRVRALLRMTMVRGEVSFYPRVYSASLR
jgi:hypothetical protein